MSSRPPVSRQRMTWTGASATWFSTVRVRGSGRPSLGQWISRRSGWAGSVGQGCQTRPRLRAGWSRELATGRSSRTVQTGRVMKERHRPGPPPVPSADERWPQPAPARQPCVRQGRRHHSGLSMAQQIRQAGHATARTGRTTLLLPLLLLSYSIRCADSGGRHELTCANRAGLQVSCRRCASPAPTFLAGPITADEA